MSDLWYKNPQVLLKDLDQFLPNNEYTQIQKINSLARLAIYYGLLIIITNNDTKWLSVSVVILLISLFLGTTENFIINNSCQKPTKNNPFMNFTHGDHISNPNRLKACSYDNSKNDINKEFRSKIYVDINDLWGKLISDRNYYTTPNTELVNDQTGFAKWCYGNGGNCKTYGIDCLKQRDPIYHRGRMIYV